MQVFVVSENHSYKTHTLVKTSFLARNSNYVLDWGFAKKIRNEKFVKVCLDSPINLTNFFESSFQNSTLAILRFSCVRGFYPKLEGTPLVCILTVLTEKNIVFDFGANFQILHFLTLYRICI